MEKKIEFVSIKTGALATEFFAFIIFVVMALFFNILVYSFPMPIAPRIICSIILAVVLIPFVNSILKSKKVIKFKIDHANFVSLVFVNKQERDEFLNCLDMFRDAELKQSGAQDIEVPENEYKVDVYYNMYDNVNGKSAILSTVRRVGNYIEIKSEEKTVKIDNFKLSRDLLWQLYPFASVFILFPLYMLVSSMLTNTFAMGMLSTLIFVVAGSAIMFLPSFLSRATLIVINANGYTKLNFMNYSLRKKFEKEVKGIKIKDRQIPKNSTDKLNNSKIYNIDKPKLPIAWTIATVIFCGIIAGLSSLNFISALVVIYMSFVFYSFFFIFNKEIIRKNSSISLRKKACIYAEIFTAKIVYIRVDDFKWGGRLRFNIYLTVEYINLSDEIKTVEIKKLMQPNFPDWQVGQSVQLAITDNISSLLISNNTPLVSREIALNELPTDVVDVLKNQEKIAPLLNYRFYGNPRLNILALLLGAIF